MNMPSEKKDRVITECDGLDLERTILAEIKGALLNPLPFGSYKIEVVYHDNRPKYLKIVTDRQFLLENSPGN